MMERTEEPQVAEGSTTLQLTTDMSHLQVLIPMVAFRFNMLFAE